MIETCSSTFYLCVRFAGASFDDSHTRSINRMMTMTTWSAMATGGNTSHCFPAVPNLSSETMALTFYAATGLDSRVRARHDLYSFHDGGVTAYKPFLSSGGKRKNSRLCHPTKNEPSDSVQCLHSSFVSFRQPFEPFRIGSV